MPQRDGAAIRIDVRGVVWQAERAGDGQRLRRKRLVQLDHVDVRHLHAGAREKPLGRGHRPDAHDARRHACGSRTHDARAWREAVFADRGARGDDQRTRAVVDPGCVARSDGAVWAHQWRELRQPLERRAGTRMFIGTHRHNSLLLCDLDRHDLFGETPGLLGGGGALLAAERKSVLIQARYRVFGRDVFGRLGHRIDAVAPLHFRVDEPPSERGVLERDLAAEWRL